MILIMIFEGCAYSETPPKPEEPFEEPAEEPAPESILDSDL